MYKRQYQYSPHDLHDYDGVNERILVDMDWDWIPRKTLVHPDRNGYVYVLDQTTGQVLSAELRVCYVRRTGWICEAAGSSTAEKGTAGAQGSAQPVPGQSRGRGKDWQPSAYSPRSMLVYIPHQNLRQDEAYEASYARHIWRSSAWRSRRCLRSPW